MLRACRKRVTSALKSNRPRSSLVDKDIVMWLIMYAALLATPIVFGIEQSLRLNGLNIFLLFCDCCFFAEAVGYFRRNKDLLRLKRLLKAPRKAVIELLVHASSVLCLFVLPLFLLLGFNGQALAWFSVVRLVSSRCLSDLLLVDAFHDYIDY